MDGKSLYEPVLRSNIPELDGDGIVSGNGSMTRMCLERDIVPFRPYNAAILVVKRAVSYSLVTGGWLVREVIAILFSDGRVVSGVSPPIRLSEVSPGKGFLPRRKSDMAGISTFLNDTNFSGFFRETSLIAAFRNMWKRFL